MIPSTVRNHPDAIGSFQPGLLNARVKFIVYIRVENGVIPAPRSDLLSTQIDDYFVRSTGPRTGSMDEAFKISDHDYRMDTFLTIRLPMPQTMKMILRCLF